MRSGSSPAEAGSKGGRLLRAGRAEDPVRVYEFVQAEKANHSIRTLRRVMRVSRSGFLAWRERPPSRRARQDARLMELIREIHAESLGTYGAPRIHIELREEHGQGGQEARGAPHAPAGHPGRAPAP